MFLLGKPKFGWCTLEDTNEIFSFHFSYLRDFPKEFYEAMRRFEGNGFVVFEMQFDLEDKGEVFVSGNTETDIIVFQFEDLEMEIEVKDDVWSLIEVFKDNILENIDEWTYWDLSVERGKRFEEHKKELVEWMDAVNRIIERMGRN